MDYGQANMDASAVGVPTRTVTFAFLFPYRVGKPRAMLVVRCRHGLTMVALPPALLDDQAIFEMAVAQHQGKPPACTCSPDQQT